MMTLAPDDPRHGTANGYGNLKCRCQPCRDAWAAKVRERVALRKARADGAAPMHVLAVVPEHGQPSRYSNHGCRCDACRAAYTEACRRWGGHGAARRFSDAEKAAAVAKAAELGVSVAASESGVSRNAVAKWCKAAGVKPPRSPASNAARHGTHYMYNRRGCRCEACRDAEADYRYLRRQRPTPPGITHGRYSAYVNYGCRCRPCKDAAAAYQRDYQLRRAS